MFFPMHSTVNHSLSVNKIMPGHTARVVQHHFAKHGINVMDWLAASPHLDPIEYLWNMLKRQFTR